MWGFQEDRHLWAGDRKPTPRPTLQWTHLQVTGASGILSLKGGTQDLPISRPASLGLHSGTTWRGVSDLNSAVPGSPSVKCARLAGPWRGCAWGAQDGSTEPGALASPLLRRQLGSGQGFALCACL